MPPGRLYPCRSSELQMIIDGGKRGHKIFDNGAQWVTLTGSQDAQFTFDCLSSIAKRYSPLFRFFSRKAGEREASTSGLRGSVPVYLRHCDTRSTRTAE
jgi:hypothetical protein